MEKFFFFNFLTEKRNPNDDWRQRYVWHRTPTGKRNKVKIKSLPKEEQWKYAPIEVKIKKLKKLGNLDRKKINLEPVIPQPQLIKKPNRVFTLFYSADRPEGSYNKFTEGKLVMATDDPLKAIEIEKKGHPIAVAHNVPIDAFIKYWDYEKKDWVSFPKDMDTEKKFELINWSNFDVFLVDFFKYKDQIIFHLSSPEEEIETKEDN